MAKEQKINPENKILDNEEEASSIDENYKEDLPEKKEISPEDKINKLEDKVARTLAEMENQRRRFEKEKEDAFEYGGYAFAKESLNLIDNLERSKQVLENDQSLQNTDALKKILDHLEIIKKDLFSIYSKNNIIPIDTINKKLDPNLH